ncbi:MAG: DUF2235 domain-containing protein [Dongiaceae bacterium]
MPDTHIEDPAPIYVVGRRRAARWVRARLAGQIDPFAAWRPRPAPAIPAAAGKAIIVCCDGTGNHPKQTEGELPAATNVYLLYDALTNDTQFGTQQITWYDPGVGTGTSRAAKQAGFATRILRKIINVLPDTLTEYADKVLKLVESATGASIEENIEQGYREIVRNYEPGDRIFVFGFSRGAYTARCIAGVIQRCGLLRSENIRFSSDVITLFRRRKSGATPPLVLSEFIHRPEDVRVHVLGLWDTVASLGLPLWGWWFRIGEFWRNKNLDSNPAAVCEYVYHALSMDERRSQFFPTVTTPGNAADQNVRQIWLRGAHADVGGGYSNRSLGDVGLEWMLQIAWHHGLKIRDDLDHIAFHPTHGAPICPKADPMGKAHDETKSNPGWNIFGAWPRWAPIYRPFWTDVFQRSCAWQFGAPHELVYRRAEQANLLWLQRPTARQIPRRIDLHMARDGLKFLNVGERIGVRIAANRVWDRTAIVFESAAIYRVTYDGGNWRDAEKRPCGPNGQSPYGLDLVRRLLYRRRRLIAGRWLELLGHVAHPRPWPVAEFGTLALFKLLFVRDPKPLTRSLIPLGKHMTAEATPENRAANSVYVLSFANNGLFYAFGNDAWATYPNNCGAIDLEISRETVIPAGAVYYTLTPRGEIVPGQETPERLRELVEHRSTALKDRQAAWPDPERSRDAAGDAEFDISPAASATSAVGFPDDAIAFPDAAKVGSGDEVPPYDFKAGVAAIDEEILAILKNLSEPPPEKGATKIFKSMVKPSRAEQAKRQHWQASWDRDET